MHSTKENQYVQIPKKIFMNINICPKAKGVLGYLLSLPKDLKIKPKSIAKELNVDERYIYNVMKQLQQAGYCKMIKDRDGTGEFLSVLYLISDEPIYMI